MGQCCGKSSTGNRGNFRQREGNNCANCATNIIYEEVDIKYGKTRKAVTCPYCHLMILTTIKVQSYWMTHLLAILILFFVFWPLYWLPYHLRFCKSTNHYCPNCNEFLGSYRCFGCT